MTANANINTVFGPCLDINFSVNITNPIAISQQPLSVILQNIPGLFNLFKSIADIRVAQMSAPEFIIEEPPQIGLYRTSVSRSEFVDCDTESIVFPSEMPEIERHFLKNRLNRELSKVSGRYIQEYNEIKWDSYYDQAMACQTRDDINKISPKMKSWYSKTKDQFRQAQLGHLRMERFAVLPAFVDDTQNFAISASWSRNYDTAKAAYANSSKFYTNTASYCWLNSQMNLLLSGAICMTSIKITELLKIRVFRKELFRQLTGGL